MKSATQTNYSPPTNDIDFVVYFGRALRELRENKNLTQKDIADILGVTSAQISAYELGKSIPDLKTVISLSKILNVNYFVLIEKAFEKSTYYSSPLLELSTSDLNQISSEISSLIDKHRALKEEHIASQNKNNYSVNYS